jgi:hypothetical protein
VEVTTATAPGTTVSRQQRLITASIVVATAGQFFGDKIDGRFAVSNIAQLLAFALLVMAVPRLFTGRDVVIVAVTVAAVLVAGVAMQRLYGYQIQLQFLAFFVLAGGYLLGMYRAVSGRGAAPAIMRGFEKAIPVALVIVAVRLAIDIAVVGLDKRSIGFDDKSHAAVACCFLAFASLRFLRTRRRLVYSAAFFVAALLTLSRLPFAFAPFYLLVFLAEYARVRAAARSAVEVYGAHLLLLALIAVPIALWTRASSYFLVFGRVFAPSSTTRDSTTAHVLLIEYALRLKMHGPAELLLGITPGGYAGVLFRSDVDISQLARVNPLGYLRVSEGTAPMHSSTGSLLLEFPIWIPVAYVVLVVACALRLVRRREWTMALFLAGFMVSTAVYSSHNELYFYVAWVALIAVAFAPTPPDGGADALAERARSRPRGAQRPTVSA